jgi:thioredoxin-like negative regulator of GroEL
MIALTMTNFNDVVKEGICVVDFMTPTCQPCKPVTALLDRLSKDYKDVGFFTVNCDTQPTLASYYGVNSVPYVIFFANGQPITRLIGSSAGHSVKITAILAQMGAK